ncbi:MULTISPECIES: hypothetical protein [unclassified Bartonella]|uniref:hypothetical protein n=1 Tax=unclassified Bartonella TaxID=2645622 RepID=UPI0035D01B7B
MWVKTVQERHAFNEVSLEPKAVCNIGSWQSFCDDAGLFFYKRKLVFSISVKIGGAEWILYPSWELTIPLRVAFCKMGVMER